MDWKQYVSVAALLFSLVSFSLTFGLSKSSAVTAVRPVLVFEYSESDGWSVRNVGNGPALNVLVATKNDDSDWLQPVRIPTLKRDGAFPLNWIGHLNVRTLGASYMDVSARQYSSTSTNDLSEVYEGNRLREWPEKAISAHWKVAPSVSR
jgi:hypothetical protein